MNEPERSWKALVGSERPPGSPRIDADIVERLRWLAVDYRQNVPNLNDSEVMAMAADEIERWQRQWDDEHELTQALDAEIERLRAAITWMIANNVARPVERHRPFVFDAGCGCCSDDLAVPPDIYATLLPFREAE